MANSSKFSSVTETLFPLTDDSSTNQNQLDRNPLFNDMDSDLERLTNALIAGNNCICGTPLLLEADELDTQSDGEYAADYSCPGCDAEYTVTVEDQKALLRLEYERTDEAAPEELFPPFQQARKEALQRQSHPAKDLVEGYHELNAALTLLWQNKKRIFDECDTIRKKGNVERDKEFHRRVHADIHNYVASAYTFNEVLQNVEPNLPTDGPVEEALESYRDEKRVITGLRVYAQHQFTIPVSYVTYFTEGEEYEQTIGVRLDEVDVIESDVERYPPDGYALGADDHHYEKVEGEYINFERRVDLHYEAAGELVGAIAEHSDDVHGDEITDYHESIRYNGSK